MELVWAHYHTAILFGWGLNVSPKSSEQPEALAAALYLYFFLCSH